MKKIKCVIFDIGGVILSTRIEPVHDAVNKKIGMKIFDKDDILHQKLLVGKMQTKEFYWILSKRCGIRPDKLRQMENKFYNKIMKINQPVVRIVRKIKAGDCKIGVISNTSPNHKRINKERFVYKLFRPVVLSCDVGCKKPDKKIFSVFLKKSRLRPEECIYIEDREKFLSTPRKIGFGVIHFRNARQLERDLRKMGVKI